MLAPGGIPQSGRGGTPSSTDRLTVAEAQGLCFRKDVARGRSGIFVGCYVGMWAGTGRCHHRMQWEGFLCQLFYYPAKGRQPAAHTHSSISFCVKGRAGTIIAVSGVYRCAPACRRKGWAPSQASSNPCFLWVVSEVSFSSHSLWSKLYLNRHWRLGIGHHVREHAQSGVCVCVCARLHAHVWCSYVHVSTRV